MMRPTGALSVGNSECHPRLYAESCREAVLSAWASQLPLSGVGLCFFKRLQAAPHWRAGSTNTNTRPFLSNHNSH